MLEVPGLKWGKDDHKDAMLGRALTYLVLYSTLGMMVRLTHFAMANAYSFAVALVMGR